MPDSLLPGSLAGRPVRFGPLFADVLRLTSRMNMLSIRKMPVWCSQNLRRRLGHNDDCLALNTTFEFRQKEGSYDH